MVEERTAKRKVGITQILALDMEKRLKVEDNVIHGAADSQICEKGIPWGWYLNLFQVDRPREQYSVWKELFCMSSDTQQQNCFFLVLLFSTE